MSRYVDAEPIQKFIENGLNNPDKKKAFGYDAVEILAEIEYAPTANVKPVIHGKWIEFGNKIECPFCKYSTILIGVDKYNYCPNCGADMRNKEE